MAETTKTTPAGPLRDPLPPIYPIPLIEVACRALEAMSAMAQANMIEVHQMSDSLAARDTAFRIIRNGLVSHERAAQEGRSRG